MSRQKELIIYGVRYVKYTPEAIKQFVEWEQTTLDELKVKQGICQTQLDDITQQNDNVLWSEARPYEHKIKILQGQIEAKEANLEFLKRMQSGDVSVVTLDGDEVELDNAQKEEIPDDLFITLAEDEGNVFTLNGFLREQEAVNYGASSNYEFEDMTFRAFLVDIEDPDRTPERVDVGVCCNLLVEAVKIENEV